MNIFLASVYFSTYVSFSYSAEQGDKCKTPNDDYGTCIPLNSCEVMKRAVMTGNMSALAFAKKSECGFDKEPLICCGAAAFFKEMPPQVNVLPDKSTCGVEKEDDRVFGGETTEIGEFPWMILLGYESAFSDELEFKCGGTMINNRYVLTAAHCLTVNKKRAQITLTVVRLGEWKISTVEDCSEALVNDECSDPVVDVKIEKQIQHNAYSRKTGNNDIGLIKMEKNVPYTEYIRPICMPPDDATPQAVGTLLVVSGWGATEQGAPSDIKLKLEVPVVSSMECAEKVKMNGEVTENQLCAGGEKGKDSCKGDSGGPLMGTFGPRKISKNQWYQEGIIAWGIGCGRRGFPGVYTRVGRYVGWIKANIA